MKKKTDPRVEKLLSLLSKAESRDERNLIMLMSLSPSQKRAATIFLEAFVKTSYPDVVFKKRSEEAKKKAVLLPKKHKEGKGKASKANPRRGKG